MQVAICVPIPIPVNLLNLCRSLFVRDGAWVEFFASFEGMGYKNMVAMRTSSWEERFKLIGNSREIVVD